MKDIDMLLRSASQASPRRELSADFTARVISELTSPPEKVGWATRAKEALHMKKMSLAVTVLVAVVVIGAVGGGTYAAVKHFSLKELNDKPAVVDSNGNTIKPADMQKIYKTYVNEVGKNNKNALSNFEMHATSELVEKLGKATGYDPVTCAQNVPQSVSFIDVDSTGQMTAVNHFADSGDIKVVLKYQSGAGVFTDITCPATPGVSAAKKMQGYYEQYVNDIATDPTAAMKTFISHTGSPLREELTDAMNAPYRASDPVVCAQNTPAMVTFKDVKKTSMTALLAFGGGTLEVKLGFDPSTNKFTSITCQTPAS